MVCKVVLINTLIRLMRSDVTTLTGAVRISGCDKGLFNAEIRSFYQGLCNRQYKVKGELICKAGQNFDPPIFESELC